MANYWAGVVALILVIIDAGAASPVGNINSFIDSTNKQSASLVRKHGQQVEDANSLIDSTPKLSASLVRNAKKQVRIEVTADGSVQISADDRGKENQEERELLPNRVSGGRVVEKYQVPWSAVVHESSTNNHSSASRRLLHTKKNASARKRRLLHAKIVRQQEYQWHKRLATGIASGAVVTTGAPLLHGTTTALPETVRTAHAFQAPSSSPKEKTAGIYMFFYVMSYLVTFLLGLSCSGRFGVHLSSSDCLPSNVQASNSSKLDESSAPPPTAKPASFVPRLQSIKSDSELSPDDDDAMVRKISSQGRTGKRSTPTLHLVPPTPDSQSSAQYRTTLGSTLQDFVAKCSDGDSSDSGAGTN